MTLSAPKASPTTAALDATARATVVERFALFAGGCLLSMLIWAVALSVWTTRVHLPALATLGIQGAILGVASRGIHRDRAQEYTHAIVLAAALLLALSSIALFVEIGSSAELLGFVLFTLCAMAALLFPWGWRLQATLTASVLGLFALVFTSIRFALTPVELAPVFAIAAFLCVAIAEGHTRSFRAALTRQWGEAAARRELTASRDTYRDLTENAHDFIWATDLEGRITYINGAGARSFGLTPEDLIGQNVDQYVADTPTNPSPSAMRAHLASGRSLPPTVIQWNTMMGQTWVEMVAHPVHDATGDVIGVRGISRDVTERWQAETALRASEARYRGLVESQEALIYRADLEGHLTFINEACRRTYGVEHEPLARLNFLTFVHPDDATHARAALQTVGRGGRYRRASRGRTPLGWRWIEWEVCAIADGTGVIQEIQGVGRDVTEQRTADEALQHSLATLREREEQLRLMGLRQVAIREEERKRLSFDLHDGVCQELVAIGILIESARQRGISPSADSTLERSQTYLRALGEHLRLLARELRPLQLSDLGLGACLRALATGMTTATTHVTIGVSETLPRLGEDMEVGIYRVAQEALGNAVRHAQARTVSLVLGTADGVLALEVRDDGCGFDRKTLRSAALGLVAMEERAVALGGRLRVRSTPGAGTIVQLECPLEGR